MSVPQWLPAWTRAEGVERVRALFATTFHDDSETGPVDGTADGVWSAPGRVNIIGEHTDYNEGLCLPTALPHRTYVALEKRDDDVVRIASAQTDEPWTARLTDIHAGGTVEGWGAYVAGVAWALREAGYPVGGFDAVVDSCVPFGASLSSSAAIECAFAVALSDVFGLGLTGDDTGRTVLVDAARRAENDIAGAPTGGLDQSASMLCAEDQALLLDFRAGLAPADFAQHVPFDLATAGLNLLVIDSRAPHQLVDGQYADRRAACDTAAGYLGVQSLREIGLADLDAALTRLTEVDVEDSLRRRVRHVVTETARTAELAELVRGGLGADGVPDEAAAARAGALMNASHASLRDDYEVTVPETDLAVDASLAAGAIGARMTGGGFGGSTIALVRADQVEPVAEAVAAAFADAGFTAPAFLAAPPSAAAGRDA
ncbi:galactokinase [Xylanimonas cellulosilytica DSM 15894]|uniref:Galactokinase n=1 Tax=Xylanimonas cellulosilytica (strain DSM 15894 / JCM 12276 / CECT 5975 / KCTC 9989 / LMG 20990 / NBRC 107835 / XIL07) TaxID=446471 RepID=D1BXI7_XYLCX|nr:galactokinase [Xylanimonas cellulosilytica]ACZ29797.1 galactokinase [Xylanimonas cellulosilytica DSM 15894]